VPPKLKRLSGPQVIGILRELGFEVASQRGSHVKLTRLSPTGAKQILTVPVHRELDLGTLTAIVRQASRFVNETELRKRFYSG